MAGVIVVGRPGVNGMTEYRFNRFAVCFFDVLGFESRFATLGLGGMVEKYEQLIHVVNRQNEETARWFGPMNFSEGAYWTAEKEPFISARLYGAYASDSILLFANADFPENRYPDALNSTPEERKIKGQDPGSGWRYHPIPCDNFLDLCNEIICHSIEIGLPLRGAISMGEAILHIDYNIFLGQPLIETARLEHVQVCIGASLATSFTKDQIVPQRYQLPFNTHFKANVPQSFSGMILDWPRHWRNTRKTDLIATIHALDVDLKFSDYYKKTEEIVIASEARASLFESPDDCRITKVYPQFSSPELELFARPVRLVPVEQGTDKDDSRSTSRTRGGRLARFLSRIRSALGLGRSRQKNVEQESG
jgi:hypothetical protein